MDGCARGLYVATAGLCAAALLTACTDANLYHRDRSPAQADRVAFSGQVCTEDPRISQFPLKVIFVVDQSNGYQRDAGMVTNTLYTDIDATNPKFDPDGDRFEAMRDIITQYQHNETVSFAIVGFGGSPRVLAPSEGSFTRNGGELEGALAALAIPQICEGPNACRDLRGALGTARSLIEGDLTDLSPGARAMTRYAIILMLSGPPSPLPEGAVYCQRAIGGPACCDPTRMDCMRDLRARICCPLGEQPCVPLDPAEPPYCCADGADCPESECVVPPSSCAMGVLVEDVRVMRESIQELGVASFNLHAIHLAAEADFDLADGIDPNDSVELLMQDIGFAGAGTFVSYSDGSAIAQSSTSLQALGLLRPQVALEAKDFIVFNFNALPSPEGQLTDTDADGLPDEDEADHGTDPANPDTDGDGITDYVEILVEFSPLSPDQPAACEDLRVGADSDLDMLTDCDEALLGTDPSLLDTDGDAMPDRLEVTMGTDYILSDWLVDSDNDGVPNGDEIRQHTDPRSSDAASHLATQYRYDVVDDGLVALVEVDQPRTISGVAIQRATGDSMAGLGWLCLGYSPAPECSGDVPWLCWLDSSERTESGGTPNCALCNPAIDDSPGQRVCLDGDGTFELPSISDGEPSEVEIEPGEFGELERRIYAEVTVAALPPRDTNEQLLVHREERNCLSFVVRNVKLAGTGPTVDLPDSGWNNIALYFAQAPQGRLTVPGLFRTALIPVRFLPPDRREPADAELVVWDDEFIRSGTF